MDVVDGRGRVIPRAWRGAALAAVAVVGAPSAARADWELWLPVELRVPVARTPAPALGRVDWRVIAEARLAGRTEGLSMVFFRTGPVVYLTPYLFVGAHVAFAPDALANTDPVRMEQEIRAELEPNLFGRVGPVTLLSRNRLEYRWRETYQRLRARSLLRANLAPRGWRVMPFLQGEVLVDLTDTRRDDPATAATAPPAPQVGQVRGFAGVGLQLAANVRVDVALMVRSRQIPGPAAGTFDTTVDAGPWLQLFMDVPPTAP